jgi:hypothetical protein
MARRARRVALGKEQTRTWRADTEETVDGGGGSRTRGVLRESAGESEAKGEGHGRHGGGLRAGSSWNGD